MSDASGEIPQMDESARDAAVIADARTKRAEHGALTWGTALDVFDAACRTIDRQTAENEQLRALAAEITAQIEAWLKTTVEYTADWPQRAFNFDERILGGIADILHRARSAGILPPLNVASSAPGEIPQMDTRDADVIARMKMLNRRVVRNEQLGKHDGMPAIARELDDVTRPFIEAALRTIDRQAAEIERLRAISAEKRSK